MKRPPTHPLIPIALLIVVAILVALQAHADHLHAPVIRISARAIH